MRSFMWAGPAFLTSAILVTCGASAQEEAKFTVKEVMTKAHGKDNLARKLLLGKATKEEKERLIDLYVILGKNKPPLGEVESWQTRTSKLLETAKAAAKDGSKENITNLRAAVDCMNCHAVHKKG